VENRRGSRFDHALRLWAKAAVALIVSFRRPSIFWAGHLLKANAAFFLFKLTRFAATARPPKRRPLDQLPVFIKRNFMLDWEYFLSRGFIVSTAAFIALIALDAIASAPANAQVQLPELTVRAAKKPKAQPRPVARRVAPPSTVPPVSPAEVVAERNSSFDQARSNLYTTIGTTSDTKSHETIEALPQGTNAPVERVLLQAPGVSQDSGASGLFHVRNDHANAQYRINGILLPDGVSGFGSILDTNFVGSLSLVTGALPAEYGLRTTGIIDLTTRTDIFNNSGSINYYFGTRTDTAQLRIWRHLRCQLPEHKFSAANESAGIVGNVFRRRAILLHWQLSANQRGHRKRDPISQSCP